MARALLLDADGTILDDLADLHDVWAAWATANDLEPDHVFEVALRTVPRQTFAEVAPHLDAAACLAEFHALEDAQSRSRRCTAFAGAAEILAALKPTDWAVVTGNLEHRTRLRFARAGLPSPPVVIDAAATARGKPHPDGYLAAVSALGRVPGECLALEDSASGVAAAKAAGVEVWAVNAGTGTANPRCCPRTYSSLSAAVTDVLRWYQAPPERGSDS